MAAVYKNSAFKDFFIKVMSNMNIGANFVSL